MTISEIDLDLLAFSSYLPFADIIASIALTFFAFLGFGVMTFAVGSLRNPGRELPSAWSSVGLTGDPCPDRRRCFGMTVDEAIRYGETAIAEAARPALDAGYTIMAVAALLATEHERDDLRLGNLTATLAESGSSRSSVAAPGSGKRRTSDHGARPRDRQSSTSRRSRRWQRVLADGLPARRPRRIPIRSETGASAFLVLLGMAVTVVVLGFFAVDTLENSPEVGDGRNRGARSCARPLGNACDRLSTSASVASS